MLIPSSESYSRAKGGRSRGRNVQNHANCMLSPLTPRTTLSSSTLGANCALSNNLLSLATGNMQQDRQLYNSGTNTGYQNLSFTSVSAGHSAEIAAIFSEKASEYELVAHILLFIHRIYCKFMYAVKGMLQEKG